MASRPAAAFDNPHGCQMQRGGTKRFGLLFYQGNFCVYGLCLRSEAGRVPAFLVCERRICMQLTHRGTVVLKTPRLLLRPLCLEDAGDMFRNWTSDPEVARYVSWEAHKSEEDSRAFLENVVAGYARPDGYNWGIVFEGTLIGSIGVARMSEADLNCEMGYCLGRRWWGRGIATEALRALIDFLFGQVGFHRVAAVHDPENPASGRVMQKSGMTREGTLRQNRLLKERFVDTVVYSILRGEWEAGT